MMGDFEDIGDDLVDTDSFINHRGAGEEPFYVPDENDSDSSGDDNDVALDWSQADLSAIMDELELIDAYSDDEQKDYDLLEWNISADGLENSDESEDEERAGGDQAIGQGDGYSSDWNDWYEYPYGPDFIQDFNCLQNSRYDVRDDLLDMLEIAERTCRSCSDTNIRSQSIHQEVQEAISDILIPGMSREGLRRLHKIVLREPSVNLRNYLENADPFVLAYVVWGLNFYLSRSAKVGQLKENSPRHGECGTRGYNAVDKERSSFPNFIYSLGVKLLSWFYNLIKGIKIGDGCEDIIRQISPLIDGSRAYSTEYMR